MSGPSSGTYGDARIGGINLVGGAVILRPPAFDHIGPAMLANVPDMCAPDLSANIAATRRFVRACTSRPSMASHTLSVCPAATASWYDGVGHMPFWEAPDRFAGELAALARGTRS